MKELNNKDVTIIPDVRMINEYEMLKQYAEENFMGFLCIKVIR